MLGRRRPLARAAVVGGTAYAVGRRGGRMRAENEQYQEQAEAAAAPEPAAPAGPTADALEQLEKLGKLKDEGVLTQEEFNIEKAKILAAT